jgi:hypothetical protein
MQKSNLRYDLNLPLPLRHFFLFPPGFSLPKNQRKIISGEMLVNTTIKRTANRKFDIVETANNDTKSTIRL